jgi:hypothetical protein
VQRRPEQHRPPRSRSHPRGGAGPAGAKHASELSASTSCAATFLVTASRTSSDAFTVGSRWTIGEHRDPSSLWCLAVEPGTRTDLMRRGQPERSRASVLADV